MGILTRALAALALGLALLVPAAAGAQTAAADVATSRAQLFNPDVTQATLGQTVCKPGWSASVRISSYEAAKIKKRQVLALYGPDMPDTAFEENHKIPISLGGNPASAANLVPQSYGGRWNARDSDKLELHLHSLLCKGIITLAQAQAAFIGDWREAYLFYFGGYP